MALKVWLPLNGSLENKGISDITVTNNGATVDNNGKIGKCYSFNNNSISITSTVLQNIFQNSTQAFSFATWIYLNTDETDRVIIFGNYNANPFVNWELTTDGKQRLCAGGTSNYTNKGNSTAVPKTTWTHIAVTYDGNITTFYQNGIKTDSATGANTITTKTPSSTFYLGSDVRTGATRLKGKLNDVRIYDHCLSPLEVKEISQGLILHYKLDGFSGGAGENILPNTTSEIRTYEYPSSSFADRFAVITTKIPEAEKYTLSFYAKSTVAGDKIRAHYYSPNTTTTCVSSQGVSRTASDGNMDFTLSTDWQLYWVTYTQTSTTAVKRVILPRMGAVGNTNGVVSGTGIVSIKCVKMEEGERVTSWTPALLEMGIDIVKIPDSSGYGNDGSIIGNTLIQSNSPRYNTSIHMNNVGTTNHIEYNALSISGAFTISFWVKAALSKNQVIFVDNGHGYEFGILNNLFYTSTTTSNGWATSKFLTNNWNHIAIRSSDGMTVELFVNGVQETSRTGAGNNYLHNQTNPWLLNRGNNSSYAADASLSDFRIYTTALSAEDITTLYHTPAQIDNLGGVHGFEFEEKTPNLLNPDLREWSKESNVTCVWNEETKYFDVNTNRDTSITSRWGIFQNITVKPNTSYLFAVDMMGTGSAMGIAAQDTTTAWPSDRNTAGDTKRYYYILTTTATNTVGRVYLDIKPSINQIAHFRNIYLGEIGEIASIKQNGVFENEDMVEYNENGRITKSGELAGSNFIEK